MVKAKKKKMKRKWKDFDAMLEDHLDRDFQALQCDRGKVYWVCAEDTVLPVSREGKRLKKMDGTVLKQPYVGLSIPPVIIE